AAQVDRISHLVSQEVVSIKQSGANALGVSLKVDAHTELFLQLTNHDGQIQASLRCERGSMDGLSGHWNQLQESLAKQNVELMPMESKNSTNNQSFNSPSDSSAFRYSDQSSSQNQQRQSQNLRDEMFANEFAAKPTPARAKKTISNNPKGWESWA